MKIFVFTDPFPTWSQTFVYDEVAGLERLGHGIRIIALAKHYFVSHPILRIIQTRDVNYYLRWNSCREWLHQLQNFNFWTSSLLPSLIYARLRYFGIDALADLVRSEKPDVFLVHFGALGELFLWLRKTFDVPFIVSFHGNEYNATQRRRYSGYQQLFSHADLFLVKSRYSYGKIVELGCPPNKVRILPFGINPDNYPFSAKSTASGSTTVKLVGVGRLVETKDFLLALEAVKMCLSKYPALRYRIIGGGPLYRDLKRKIKSLGLEQRCFLLGPQNSHVVSGQLAASDIYLQPGRCDREGEAETFGNTLLEAQLHGLPVVSTNVGSIPELVAHEQTGLLAPESNAAILAEYLLTLIDNRELRNKMGKNGRLNVLSNFNSQTRVVELEQILNGLRRS